MVAIPPDDAARQAWDALPDGVRASVIARAARGEGHPDPAVAAVAVGRARAERWPWWRTAMLGVGLCLCAGGFVAIVAAGSTLFELQLPGMSALGLPTMTGFFLMDRAQRLPVKDGLPHAMEAANLRTFLAAPGAQPGGAPGRSGLTPRRVAVAGAVAAGVLAVAYNAADVAGLPGGLLGGLSRDGIGIAVGVAILAALFVYQARRRPMRVRAGADGLRFYWLRKPIPWTDVASVEIGANGAVWSMQDGSTVETSLSAHGRCPEETIIAARSAMAAVKQSA